MSWPKVKLSAVSNWYFKSKSSSLFIIKLPNTHPRDPFDKNLKPVGAVLGQAQPEWGLLLVEMGLDRVKPSVNKCLNVFLTLTHKDRPLCL